jgi:ComF family protein
VSSIPRVMAATSGRAFDLLLPPACVACGVGVDPGDAPVCTACWLKLPRVHPPWCPTCGCTRTTHAAAGRSSRCGECLEWPDLRMEEMTVRLVHSLKYGGWRRLAPRMASAMTASARRLAGPASHRLVPVPLSEARRRERGFNQAELLGRGLADETGWPLVKLLRRRRAGEQQARLGRRGRAENVLGVFEVTDLRRASSSGSILLVDDVVTTGATAAACADAVTSAGLRCSGVVSFARAARPIDTHG